MASETHKKRQKEAAGREKKQNKTARLAERRNPKEKPGNELPQVKPDTVKSVFHLMPKGKTRYFTRPAMPGHFKRKSEVTLYNVKSSWTRAATPELSVA